jgi:hypothetical protein
MLARALVHSGGEFTIDQLKFMLVRGEQTLLVASEEDGPIQGAAAVIFENFPNERIAFITAIGGRLIACQDLFEQLVEWGRINGATKIRGVAGLAVTRLWKQKFGFAHRYNIVERDIRHEST